ncbi:GNAT family N-acetyltransferase [Candidatus Bathyarchaeota archaeon]|jgi:RimJ/RimL family protein N-acetyltransferase|nr:GNAT family N-acetyltransferase [Candidatus Bathyarchaeota archaeon]MBT4320486.1 GNAT family N-acetyltransferase [Candidatus Bathyarchaeota archaeon]MBT4424926.1 GNAT family N-acetyltransferase [Candidatus Bathyarchaeota archaeon]MBT5642758.1 GNAT family N-acetyltransferase [Candidatus Bathyarchaeota archaeon]MBT6604509.1 GNAT family N-acetyltransferase [Candidatus Bathyarchaeota archaeon]
MKVQFLPAEASDADELTRTCKVTFDDDTFKHTGKPVGGAPGYDDVNYQLNRMRDDIYLKIMLDGEIIGGIIIEELSQSHKQLIRIWILPDHQDKKIGQSAMMHIHENYPARKWTLETPPYAVRNHHFYEKLGYINKGWLPDCPEPLYVYEKEIE